jgi:hypothetical protein
MKTIFIFNDSRPTDHLHSIVALGEDGQRISCIKFDSFTVPHALFAMGVAHSLNADDPDIVDPVNTTRARIIACYDAIYGVGNWMPMWLDAPHTNNAWCHALKLFRQHRQPVLAPAFGNEALAGILGAIFGNADAVPHTTH